MEYINAEISTWVRGYGGATGIAEYFKVKKVTALYLYDFHGLKICLRIGNGEFIVFDAVSGYKITESTNKQIALKKAEKYLKNADLNVIRGICMKMAPWYGISFLGRKKYEPYSNTLFVRGNMRKYNNRTNKGGYRND